MSEKEKEVHPSYGVVEFARITGSPGPLFGSSIDHSNFIRLRICRASQYRDLNHTWVYEEDRLIEVDLSPVQFAELLTTHSSPGACCTIRSFNGEEVPDPECVSVREQFRDEFEDQMKGLAKRMEDDARAVRELLEKKNLNKEDRKRITDAIDRIHTEIRSNIPFVHSSFDEACDKTISEAKGEIDAFLTNAVVHQGRLAVAAKIEAGQLAAPTVTVKALEAKQEKKGE